jgi:hypothetical protein
MSYTIEVAKENGLVQIGVIPKPLVLCQLTATDGDTVCLTTAAATGGTSITYGGNTYQARIQNQVIEAIQAQSPQGYDIPGSVTLTIADGDFAIWRNHANAHGWRGGTLTVTFVLWDIPSNSYSSNAYNWTFILGKANMDFGRGVITVDAMARSSMTRLKVPNVARGNMCPWQFPATADQRRDGLTNPSSPYYQCGYSPDVGGVGNVSTANRVNASGQTVTDGAGVYIVCDYTRSCGESKADTSQGCMARHGNYSGTFAPDGDITKDTSGRATARFGGDTWLPPTQYNGRQYVTGQKTYGFNPVNNGPGQYYNQVYGKQWVICTVLEPAGDPNSLRAECVVCVATNGQVNIDVVLVNGVQIPAGAGDVLFTWRYITQGGRNGAVNGDAIFDNHGDPHGSLAVIEFVVPFQLAAGGSIPTVQALVSGPPTLLMYPISSAVGSGGNIVITFPGANALCAGNPPFTVGIRGNGLVADGSYTLINWTYGPPGTITLSATGSGSSSTGYVFFYVSNTNPVWHLMDLLTWGPFLISDFDPVSWYNAAAFCDEPVSYVRMDGTSASHARYKSSFALQQGSRQQLAQAVTALRNCAGIILSRNPLTGLLQCSIEQTLADQQPNAIAGSNYNTPVASIKADGSVANGCLAYLFDGAGSIELNTFKLGGTSINDTPNAVTFPFQDEDNQWQQDSLETTDDKAYTSSGNQEIAVPVPFMGIPNFDQGRRRSNTEFAKALYGNTRFDAGGSELPEFTTTVKAIHLASMVGAICGLTYEQAGL